MSDDTSGDGPAETGDEMLKNFTEIFQDQGLIEDDTGERLRRAIDQNATQEDMDRLNDSMESWLDDVLGDSSSEQ